KKQHVAELNNRMRGDLTMQQLGTNMLTYLVPAMHAQVGAFYVFDRDSGELRLNSSYAMQRRRNLSNSFALGESLVGQCGLENKQTLLEPVPESSLSIPSASGAASPRSSIVPPIVHDDERKGVLEIAAFRVFDQDDMEMLEEGV